jgi:hypothetical protein
MDRTVVIHPKQGLNTTWRCFDNGVYHILYQSPTVNGGFGLTARNHAFLLTSPMINSISAPCSFNEKNHVISIIPTIYAEKKSRGGDRKTPRWGRFFFYWQVGLLSIQMEVKDGKACNPFVGPA